MHPQAVILLVNLEWYH